LRDDGTNITQIGKNFVYCIVEFAIPALFFRTEITAVRPQNRDYGAVRPQNRDPGVRNGIDSSINK
jgi:hypothetical protein